VQRTQFGSRIDVGETLSVANVTVEVMVAWVIDALRQVLL